MGKPAARITDNHVCPMVTGTVPHVGGPVVMGSPNVFTGNLPQARVGDMLVCVGPPDVIAMGSSGVFVNNKPAARLGDSTAHGGVIVVGLPTVLIGEMGGGSAGGAMQPASGAALAYAAFEAQVKVLMNAAKSGAPFCEICFQKALDGLNKALKAPAAKTPAVPAKAPALALAPKTPPAPTKSNPAIVCQLVSVQVTCSHGRKPGPSDILMVVPSTVQGPDTVSGKITMKGGCGDHPHWTVSGASSAQGKSNSFSIPAKASLASASGILGLQNVSPQTYDVVVAACGGGQSYAVHAYPPGKISGKINFEDFKDHLRRMVGLLPVKDAEKMDDDAEESEKEEDGGKPVWFKGAASWEGSWQEDKTWEAFYEKKYSIGFDPLASVKRKFPVYPLSLIPPALEDSIRLGLYLEIGVSGTLQFVATQKYWPARDANVWVEKSVTGGAKIVAALSLDLKLVDEKLVSASISGEGSVSGEAKSWPGDGEAAIAFSGKFDGIVGKVTCKAAWGLVEFSREIPLVGGSEPLTGKIQLYGSPPAGGSGE